MTAEFVLTAEAVEVEDTWEAYQAMADERGWGDGLPLVPPTRDRIEAAAAFAGGSLAESVGRVPPSWREATRESIAINAVMAGCDPAYLPVVTAAVSAVVDPVFNLYGIQATTNPVAPLVVVNGPVRHDLGLNSGSNALGPGWRANATIGRALRLVLANVGDAKPWAHDRATHGFPAKFTFCAAEHEEASPWEPLHVQRGFEPHENVVTVMGIQAFHNIVEFISTDAREVLDVMADNMAAPGTNNVSYGGEPALVLSPEHARMIADGGFSLDDIRRYLFERARCDMTRAPEPVREMLRSRRPGWTDLSNLPIADRPEDIVVLVIGGAGTHSAFLPTFGPTTAVSRPIC